jgi:hypothetical protein
MSATQGKTVSADRQRLTVVERGLAVFGGVVRAGCGSVALGQPLGDGGREPLAALSMVLLVLGWPAPTWVLVADHLAAAWPGPSEHAWLLGQVGRPLRRGHAAPARPGELGHAQGLAHLVPGHACLALPLDEMRAPVRAARSTARAIRMAPPGSGCSPVNDALGHGGAWTICAPVMYARRSTAALTAVPLPARAWGARHRRRGHCRRSWRRRYAPAGPPRAGLRR